MAIHDNKETKTYTGSAALDFSMVELAEQERQRILSAPLHRLTIDDVIAQRLNDPAIFGRTNDEKSRCYWLHVRSDVRIRRMIADITKAHAQVGFLESSARYVSVQHGRMIDYVKHADKLNEIDKLYSAIEETGSADKKDERDDPIERFIHSPYRGSTRPKIGFLAVDEEDIKKDAQKRGIAVSTYNTICVILSCQTSKHISSDCIEACDWFTKKYERFLDDRIRDLEEILEAP